jgi:O-acetyl-ADP-ribose deacetylase (regulator of RNase III)
MGRGVALQFKNTFPDNFKAYVAACNREEVNPGKMFVFETHRLTNPKFIINFPTKRHWKGKSRIEDIKSGLEDLVHIIREKNIKSIAIPPLGSGLGGLNWIEVKPLIEEALRGFNDLQVIIFEPRGAPEDIAHTKDVPDMSAGRAALVTLMQRYLNGLLDPFITLLEVHKLMYFLQEAGEPLNLKYSAAHRGPYAGNLRHVLNKVEGHLVSGYGDGGDAPDKELCIIPGAVEDAEVFLRNSPKTIARINQVVDLVDGFETPSGLELLATVHWVANKMGIHSVDEAVEKTHAWNEGKKKFTPRQISLAYAVLEKKNWALRLNQP